MRWTVVAGDAREGAAAAHLASLGDRVVLFGRPGDGPGTDREGAARAFGDADAVLGPALGTTPGGEALFRPAPAGPLPIDPAWLELCAPGTPWLIGRAGPWLLEAAAARGLPVHAYARRADFATLNAVPTAEGAIAEACRRAGRTAWGASALVLGGGRCARALAARLLALGSDVCCLARAAQERAELQALGADAAPLADAPVRARRAELIFNTVPAPLVTRDLLAALPAGAVVCDIASAPGGTDFEAARALGVQAALLPGLPGRLFPATAGRIVAEVARAVLAEAGAGPAHGPVPAGGARAGAAGGDGRGRA